MGEYKYPECSKCFYCDKDSYYVKDGEYDECYWCSIDHPHFFNRDKVFKCHLSKKHQEMYACAYNENGWCFDPQEECTATDDDEWFREHEDSEADE